MDDKPSSEQQAYYDERKLYIELERDASQSFDKFLITLSAGALALSIAFMREIAPRPRDTALLVLAWGLFAASLLAMLASFLASQEGMRRCRDIIDARYSGGSEDDSNVWRPVTRCLNVFAIIAFIGGVASLAAFSAANLP
jgi:hypothetical protein